MIIPGVLAYILARAFLVVESFLQLARLPVCVFGTGVVAVFSTSVNV